MPLRLGQGLRHAALMPRPDHLGGAFLIDLAVNDAIGARAALTVGATAIALGVLRELAVALSQALLSVSAFVLGRVRSWRAPRR